MVLLLCNAAAVAALVALAGSMCRRVAADERIVLVRDGRVREVLGPGWVLTRPWRDRRVRMSLRTCAIPLAVHARSTAGDRLVLLATLHARIGDPMLVRHHDHPALGFARVAEDHAAALLGSVDRATLLDRPDRVLDAIRRRLTGIAPGHGFRVEGLHHAEVDVRLVGSG